MHPTSIAYAPSLTLPSGATIPDSKMAREVTELVTIQRTHCCSTIQAASTTFPLQLANGKVSPSIRSCCM